MNIESWRLKQQRYGLVGEICDAGHKVFPPKDICPDCGTIAKTPFKFSGKGEVYSYTTVYEAPTEHTWEIPYSVGLIKLKEGPMLTAKLTDYPSRTKKVIIDNEEREIQEPDVDIGDQVEMVTRILKKGDDRDVIIYGYKFRPKDK